jgi:hypothetical protein
MNYNESTGKLKEHIPVNKYNLKTLQQLNKIREDIVDLRDTKVHYNQFSFKLAKAGTRLHEDRTSKCNSDDESDDDDD